MATETITRICDVEDCDNPHKARGYCNKHLQRWVKWGNATYVFVPQKTVCAYDGCERDAGKRGLCEPHYKASWKRNEFTTPQRLCAFPGCEMRHISKGYCSIHYGRWRKNGDPAITQAWRPQGTPEERFWVRVALTADDTRCWLWQACTNEKGYGMVTVDGKAWLTHCYSWFLATGQHPTLCILHHCDTPSCVNPKHLFEGTRADNNADMDAKGRRPLGENCSYAVLTNNQVLKVRQLLKDGMRVGEVARTLDIDRRRVTAIKTGKSWRSVQLEG